MQAISLDFGASTTDLIYWQDQKIKKIETLKSSSISQLEDFLKIKKIDLRKIDQISITGGKSRKFNSKIQGVPIKKVGEIEAIGKGGFWLLKEGFSPVPSTLDPILVVSMGTGTCLVKAGYRGKKLKSLKCQHLGGTGVGGGTFLGLAKELLGEMDIPSLIKMFKQGKKENVDLSVREIIGGGIGIIKGSVTASNLAKLTREINFSKADLAAGIANLIGETIGVAAVFAARAEGIKKIVLTGKLTRIEKILETILEVGKIYRTEMIVPKNAEFVSAIGAGVFDFT